ncbi:hypothetical protein SAMN05216302_1001130 [Nitrosomonas aestuarii]|uniref:Uncharacterized protein n=1 Tax=Nitrosomonas aestuarii TaxID=52441 RepID=A0A1I3X5S0_9PROT|nr:hypothetical protein [Nitrosomonas aestuarii]SFK14910.1 hypothetical protein SAMN05216302_1001130 [Nitrosomonas aestuarii]
MLCIVHDIHTYSNNAGSEIVIPRLLDTVFISGQIRDRYVPGKIDNRIRTALCQRRNRKQKGRSIYLSPRIQKSNKDWRVIFRTAVDVFTLEFLETIGTPAELHFDGDEMPFHVAYDEHDRIDGVKGCERNISK